mgnify:CR=1 FL=1
MTNDPFQTILEKGDKDMSGTLDLEEYINCKSWLSPTLVVFSIKSNVGFSVSVCSVSQVSC